jgi:peptide deformylase
VLRYPNPALKSVARPLEPDERNLIEQLARDLADTMRANERCVGLAAPQLGQPLRMIVVDVSEHPRATDHNGFTLLVNPRVVFEEGAEVAREGCLSIPELTANVRRATTVVVEAMTPEWDARTIESVGFEARCLQHEIDHLDGILFLDHLSLIKRQMLLARYRREHKDDTGYTKEVQPESASSE